MKQGSSEIRDPAGSLLLVVYVYAFALEKFTQSLSRPQFPHLQSGTNVPLMTSKDHCEVCLLMILRMLGTYKYFLRRAGIFPLAIRLEEVCSLSSVHL